MDQQFHIRSPSVMGEDIDGEVVIMNLATGHYFSTQGTGRLIWLWLAQGDGTALISRRLAARFEAPSDVLAAALEAFIARLLALQLIVEGEPDPGQTEIQVAAAPERLAFTPPELAVYTDMQDMLLLDPMDDVDEVGWPSAAPRAPAGPEGPNRMVAG